MPSFHRLLLTLSLLSLLFFLSSFAPISASREFPATLSKVNRPNPFKIRLSVYYESLCPYSAHAIVFHIAKLFENGIINIVDLKLVPFGNAKIYENNTVECQHGADECMLNIVQACAIHIWRPQQSVYFSFIACIEEKYLDYKRTEWRECFDKLSLDPEPIDECYDSGAGLELLRINEGKTNALQPPKTYLPWITVNGESLNKDFENLERIICNSYRGPNCWVYSHKSHTREHKNLRGSVKMTYIHGRQQQIHYFCQKLQRAKYLTLIQVYLTLIQFNLRFTL